MSCGGRINSSKAQALNAPWLSLCRRINCPVLSVLRAVNKAPFHAIFKRGHPDEYESAVTPGYSLNKNAR